jgi:hypothetical protein
MNYFMARWSALTSRHLPPGGSFRTRHVALPVDPSLLLKRYSKEELRRVARQPCPVSNPGSNPATLNDMKILRRELKIPESTVCALCPHKDSCPLAKALPDPAAQPTIWTVPSVISAFYEYF